MRTKRASSRRRSAASRAKRASSRARSVALRTKRASSCARSAAFRAKRSAFRRERACFCFSRGSPRDHAETPDLRKAYQATRHHGDQTERLANLAKRTRRAFHWHGTHRPAVSADATGSRGAARMEHRQLVGDQDASSPVMSVAARSSSWSSVSLIPASIPDARVPSRASFET